MDCVSSVSPESIPAGEWRCSVRIGCERHEKPKCHTHWAPQKSSSSLGGPPAQVRVSLRRRPLLANVHVWALTVSLLIKLITRMTLGVLLNYVIVKSTARRRWAPLVVATIKFVSFGYSTQCPAAELKKRGDAPNAFHRLAALPTLCGFIDESRSRAKNRIVELECREKEIGAACRLTFIKVAIVYLNIIKAFRKQLPLSERRKWGRILPLFPVFMSACVGCYAENVSLCLRLRWLCFNGLSPVRSGGGGDGTFRPNVVNRQPLSDADEIIFSRFAHCDSNSIL